MTMTSTSNIAHYWQVSTQDHYNFFILFYSLNLPLKLS